MFPVWLITIGLVAFLSYLTRKTMAKGRSLYRNESKPPTSKDDLQLVHIDQQDAELAEPVRVVVKHVSAEPTLLAPGNASAFRGLTNRTELPTTSNTRGDAPKKPQEVALVMRNISPAQSDDLQSSPDGIVDKAASQLQPTVSSSSAQPLKNGAEADNELFHPFTPDASQAELNPEPSPRQQSNTSFAECENSHTTSSNPGDDAVPLLRHGSISGAPSDGRCGTREGHLTSGSLQQPAHAQTGITTGFGGYRDALKRLPWKKLLAALAMWLVFAVLQLAKSQTRTCSVAYWSLYTLQAILLLGASALFVHLACWEQQNSMSRGNDSACIQTEQRCWSRTTLMGASVVGVAGGALAAVLGMGGGVVMGPLMLSLQVHPLASAATSTLMILFSSSAATLSFAVNGNINAQYALVYAPCNFLSSLAGVFIVGRIVRKTGKSAMIVILLACLMAAGAVASAVSGGHQTLQDFRSGTNLTFTNFCV